MRSLAKALESLSKLVANIKKVWLLAYEIDKGLLLKYYFTAFIGAVSPLVAAFILKIFIDKLIKLNQIPSPQTVPLLVIYLLVAYYLTRLVETITYWGLNVAYYDYLLRNRLQSGLLYRFSQKIGSLDLGHLENSETQNLITKVRDSYQWQIPDFIRVWNYVFFNIVGIVVAFFALISYGWWIPFVIILVTLPRFYLKLKNGIFVWSMYGTGAPEAKKLWYFGWLLNEPNSILETRVFQSQKAILEKMKQTQDSLYERNKIPLDNYKKVLIFAPILESLVILGIIFFFVPKTLTGALSIGTLTFIITTLDSLRSNTTWGAAHFGELYEKNLFIAPYYQLMDLPKLIKEKLNPHKFSEILSPKIEFKNVSFNYPNGKEVLKNLSFVIHPGENLALVGNNGAGKTTIIKLLCRFYDVTSGEILVNGVNLKDLELNNWYNHLGTLFQDFMKYQFTIRENIMLGKPDLKDEDRMIDAATKAGVSEFINKYPKKYEQMLGRRFEDGEELSGGQWQKLAIARAFYQQAPILIMDEPTSAIDAEAEFEIFNNLEKLYRDKTLILVSHRFSTVRNANKILVIDGGRLIEEGTHEELLAKKGKYSRMFATQAKGYM